MYGLSNGANNFDLRYPLKDKGQTLKTLKSNISKTVRDREKVSIEDFAPAILLYEFLYG